MTDPIRDAAIEAAAKAYAEDDWDRCNPFVVRTYVTPLVDAVLAEVRPMFFELRKTAIREARAEALRGFADTRGVHVGDEDSEWWQGYRQAQHECRLDAIDRADEDA